MATYRWTHPASWLEGRLDECDHEEAIRIARLLLSKLDSDSVQDLFQDEMDEDGYFEELECLGHESLSGPIGNTIYCDGSCRL